ncbi:glycoside hydrolase family 97 catalytic domain-containing protein [Haloarcula amylovorans]|uniref:glycoside hydrolase family 97 catalytic domain-containing protein n=1 Tax=Haloarcula amylovorans TaxID=2562280 RepID=UPI0014316616|nr:glycoside hydrolase family 97 catalytic domain-containing protein [Halomicroarcula amylolytica]
MVSRQSQQTPNGVGRREFLGGVASLLAAAAYTRDVPESVAAQIDSGDDSETRTVTSPNGNISVTVDVSGGTPTYSVDFNGTTYIQSSALGFDFQNQATFGASTDGTSGATISVTGSESNTGQTESWTPEWDQYNSVSEAYNELRLGLEETASPGRSGNLELRVFDDGLGFRFAFDDDFAANSGKAVITSENTQVNFAGDYTCWWIENAFTNPRFESEYTESKLSEVPAGSETVRPNDDPSRRGSHMPLTVKASDSAYLSVHQADLDDYSLASLAPVSDSGGTEFATQLAPLSGSTKVSWTLPNATPWRTVQLGTTPGELVESSLIPLLNEDRDDSVLPSDGNGGVDTDWLTPRKYIGIWWTMIAGNAKWEYKNDADIEATGNNPAAYIHGARTERMKRYMNFASQNSIDSVLAEGWNKGWSSYGSDASATGSALEMGVGDSYPDFDVTEITTYGSSLSNPVEFTIHNETSGNLPNYEDEILNNSIFSEYDDAGIRSIKNGYVSNPGLFGDNESSPSHNQHCQLAVNHHRTVIKEAASERQTLEIHEGIVPTGERRTYPNVAAREVVKAQEYDGFGALGSNVGREHHVTLPFTRMLAGPTSYQPGIFDITFNDSEGDQIQTTRAKQLAMYPTYNAGIQMAADRVEAYINEEFEVGEYVQAPSGIIDGLTTSDDWRNTFGTNYVGFDPNKHDSGSNVSFTVKNVSSAGTYDLHIRYASDDTENAQRVIDAGGPQLTLNVNGSTQKINPTFTEYWDTYGIHTVSVSLNQGDNTVALEMNYDDSGETFKGDVAGLTVNTIGVTAQGANAPFPAAYTDLTDSQVANENVESKPDFKYIEDVPAGGWDDTTVVDAEIGKYIVTARKKDNEWYVGAMTDGNGRAIDVPLDFLDSQSNGWKMEMYTDEAGTDVDTDPTEIARTTSLVSSGDIVLASMARSGGTALRLVPASSDEASNLDAYVKPSQSLDVTIDGTSEVSSPFITATGSNSSDTYVGGTNLEVVIDGQTVSNQNVRLAPGATDVALSVNETIETPGTYTVTLKDARTGATFASETVVVEAPRVIAKFSDSTGDDTGDGSYSYPEADAFSDGCFDIESFTIEKTSSLYRFTWEVDTLENPFGGTGFSPQLFALWLRDPSASDGAMTENGDLMVDVDFAEPWQYRLRADGWAKDAIDHTGAALTDGNGDAVIPNVDVESAAGTVTLSVPRSAFGNVDPWDMEILPIVGSQESGSILRDVVTQETATEAKNNDNSGDNYLYNYRLITSNDTATNAPRVVDMITPVGTTQSEALAYSAEEKAQLPFTPVHQRYDLEARIAEWTDPEGDDDGPGAYVYPTDDQYGDADFDIRRFGLYETGDRYKLFFRMEGDITNPFGYDANFSHQFFQVYIRDPNASGGSTKSRRGVSASDSPVDIFAQPHHYRVVACPKGAQIEKAGASVDDTAGSLADSTTTVSTDVSITPYVGEKAFVIDMPKSAFNSPARDLEAIPFVHGFDDGYSNVFVRWVQENGGTPMDWKFTGGTGDYSHLNVIDTVVPDETSQSTVLDYNSAYSIPYLSLGSKAASIKKALAGNGPVTSAHFDVVREAYESNSAVPGTGGLVPDYADLRGIASEVTER